MFGKHKIFVPRMLLKKFRENRKKYEKGGAMLDKNLT